MLVSASNLVSLVLFFIYLFFGFSCFRNTCMNLGTVMPWHGSVVKVDDFSLQRKKIVLICR